MLGNLLPQRRAISYQDVWGKGGDWEPLEGPRLSSVEARLGVAAVYSCVDLIASRIAAMDRKQWRDRGADLPASVSLSPVLRAPNAILNADEWVYQGVAVALLFGEVIGITIARDERTGWPRTIDWLNPAKIAVAGTASGPEYRYGGVRLDRTDVIHWRLAPMVPGVPRGVSPLSKLNVELQQAVRSAAYQLDWFKSGGLPLAVLANTESPIDDEQADRVAARYDQTRKSRGRKPLVFGKGWTFTAVNGTTGSDAGLNELEKRIATKVANAFHVPPEWVGGETGNSMTYTSPRAMSEQLDRQALFPVYRPLQRFLSEKLLPAPQFFTFDPDSILSIDPKTMVEIDEKLVRSGIATVNERRRAHAWEPVDGGDERVWPPYSTSVPKPAPSGASGETP